MGKKIDLTGRKIGRLSVIMDSGKRDKYGNVIWKCQCDCGNITEVNSNSIRRNLTRSCGCLHKEKVTKHGFGNSRIYNSWQSMKNRCLNLRSVDYHRYGGRGITICDRWMKFENFLDDMGERPEGKSLDRENNNGNYEPSNCKWSTPKEQANNRRTDNIGKNLRRKI